MGVPCPSGQCVKAMPKEKFHASRGKCYAGIFSQVSSFKVESQPRICTKYPSPEFSIKHHSCTYTALYLDYLLCRLIQNWVLDLVIAATIVFITISILEIQHEGFFGKQQKYLYCFCNCIFYVKKSKSMLKLCMYTSVALVFFETGLYGVLTK